MIVYRGLGLKLIQMKFLSTGAGAGGGGGGLQFDPAAARPELQFQLLLSGGYQDI